jgi:hypothetical protein
MAAKKVMRAISYTLISIGFILAAAAEGFCIGLLLSIVILSLFFHDAFSGDFVGPGLFMGVMIVVCTFLSALFQVPLLWEKVRPQLTKAGAVRSSD